LYPPATTTSAHERSAGSQPSDWVASRTTRVSGPISERSASRSTTAPSADATTLTATTSADRVRSGRSSSGTSVTSCPAPANGKVTLVNSRSAVSTRAPAGSDAATRPRRPETAVPRTTEDVGTPTSRAKAARAVSTASSNPGAELSARPQAATASETASTTGRGGTPMDGVLR
jgi:hypothetical protein